MLLCVYWNGIQEIGCTYNGIRKLVTLCSYVDVVRMRPIASHHAIPTENHTPPLTYRTK